MLEEIPTLVGPMAMRRAIGATLAELTSLEADGMLIPRTRAARVKSPWRISDGLSLLQELEQRAVPIDEDAPGWETIQLGHKRLGISVGHLIATIREGRVRVGKRVNVFGYHGIVVPLAEVGHVKGCRTGAIGEEIFEPSATIEGEIAAAAFARSIGVRENSAFQILIEQGHTPASKVLHPVTRRSQWRMSSADIAAFHAKFTTPSVIAEEAGLHPNTILAALAARNDQAFQPDGVSIGPIYLREEMTPALKALQA